MKQELIGLRKGMFDNGIDAYYIPSGDFHGSEYFCGYFKVCEYLSGFTGEAADMIVTDDGAWLWTDGRFFLQAGQQLEGTGIELMKIGEPGVPSVKEFITGLVKEYRDAHPSDEYVIGFDGRVVPASFGRALEEIFAGEEWNVAFRTDEDLADSFWKDRPGIEAGRIWDFPVSSAGVDTADKIAAVREKMKEEGTDYLLLTDLMENAWLFNLRGSDILYTPVFFSFALLTQDSVKLYVMKGALPEGLPERLSFVEVRDHEDIYDDIRNLREGRCGDVIWYDPETCNYELFSLIPSDMEHHAAVTPVALMKMIKNDTEIEGFRRAHIMDGIAVTKLIKWLRDGADGTPQTEISVSDKLESLRRMQDGCFDLSFTTIAGYGPNGAIIHYSPTPESDAEIRPEGFLLVDSGGQYIDGTTDITRTIAVGPLTREMINDYTLVLKSHVRAAMFRQEPGMTAWDLNQAAREPMRAAGLDFNHGLGHGVGHVLSVHEGPNRIGKSPETCTVLQAGMVMSDEPGVYLDGKFGVRIENLVLFKEDGEGCIINEPLTCVPYERRAINKDLLTEEEIFWIDSYHKWVRDTLSPLLDEETAAFLTEETKPL